MAAFPTPLLSLLLMQLERKLEIDPRLIDKVLSNSVKDRIESEIHIRYEITEEPTNSVTVT